MKKCTDFNNKNNGYTLLEVAIVLVIIGLLVSASMAGIELMKTAKVRSAISEVETYQVATRTFQEQYEGLPGDISNATSFWISGTANGNGDERIGDNTDTDYTEPFYAWDQLSLARLVAGVYSGAGSLADVGVNCPESSSIDGAGYSMRYFATPFSHADASSKPYPGNYIVMGKNSTGDNYLATAGISPFNAYSIDSKIDDGFPDSGHVLASDASSSCSTGSGSSQEYDTSLSTIECVMLFSAD